MNTTLLGAARHLIQVAAGAVGATAYQTGAGHELAVAAVVGLANLAWFAWSNRKTA